MIETPPQVTTMASPAGERAAADAGRSRLRFHLDRSAKTVFLLCALVVVALIGGILFFLAKRGLGAFIPMASNTGKVVGFREVFLSTEWAPSLEKFGVLPFIAGSLSVTFLALALAAPTGVLTGVFVTKLAPGWMKSLMRQVMDLLVGIPSVVYGIFGLTVVLPKISASWLKDAPAAGFAVAAAILAIMIVPTIVSLSMDAFEALPASLDEGSQALGSTRWQSIWRVLIPAAMPRLITAVVLGMGRAIGEAMAVQMVIGNNPQWIALMKESTANSAVLRILFTPAATLTTELVQELPNTPSGSTWNNVLFAMGLLLYLLTMAMILATRRLGRQRGAA